MEKFNLLFNSPSNWTMFGELKSQKRAREMFPMLVARASERKTMSFGELAKHFNTAFWHVANQVRCGMHHRHSLQIRAKRTERGTICMESRKNPTYRKYGDEIKRRACGFRCHAVATSRTSSGF